MQSAEECNGGKSILSHPSLFTDDEGVVSVAAYPKRLTVEQVQARMKAMSLCVRINAKSPLVRSSSKWTEISGMVHEDHVAPWLHLIAAYKFVGSFGSVLDECGDLGCKSSLELGCIDSGIASSAALSLSLYSSYCMGLC